MSEAAWPDGLLRETIAAESEDPSLEVLATGPAPQFLFLHGSGGRAAFWAPVMAALAAQGAEAAALSFRAHGESGGRKLLQAYRIMDYARDTERALGAMAAPPVLVGHAMGGLVAQLVAEEQALPGLALLASCPVGGMQGDGARLFLRRPMAFLRAMRARSYKSLFTDEAMTRWLLFGPDAPQALVRRYMDEVGEESWLAGGEMTRWLPAPQRVRCPVMVVGGEEDNTVSPASVRRTAQAYGVEPVMLPRHGHMLPIEAEPEALAALLLDFRRRVAGGGAAPCATTS